MLSYARQILDKTCWTHSLTYLQYADYGQCISRAILPIGVNDGGKEKKKRRKEEKK